MKALVTGSAGHLGEAMVRKLRARGDDAVSVDVLPGPFTSAVGSIVDREFVRRSMAGVGVVYHCATLHKPHVATHTRQEFVDVNVTGTLNLLEEAVRAGVGAFVFTSTTSAFGDALTPPAGAPAAWITEEVRASPKNIYGVTKTAAEDLCQLFYRNQKLPCVVLRTSRFFPEDDDNRQARGAFESENLKANEYLHRRVEIEDVVDAHILAAGKAGEIGFGKYIISATTPFTPGDLAELRANAPAVVRRYVPAYKKEYERRGWRMAGGIDRVYVNEKARRELGWRPRWDFGHVVERLRLGEGVTSAMAVAVGSKGYHAGRTFAEGPFPVE
jgi:UDP-glucose 4-epimerase